MQATSFGELLRRCRLAAGLTQEELAERSGLSARAISDLERGVRRAPYRETVRLLADALGIDAADREALEAAARRPRGAAILPEHPAAAGASESAAPPSTSHPEANEVAEPETGWVSKLVGRLPEMEALRTKLTSALAGRGGLVLLAGEAGIGKTRLVEELASEAGRRGFQVQWGRCWESEGAPPFWPWVEILRGVVRGRGPRELRAELGSGAGLLAELVPELRESASGGPELPPTPLLEPGEARFQLFDAITAAITYVARSQPLLPALDDLHWADKPSLLLLQFLLQRLGEARLLVVGTYRDVELERQHPLAEVLPSLRRERNFERIGLEGLPLEAVGGLVTSFLGQPAEVGGSALGGLSRALWQQTEGNAFFVQEELRYLIESDRLVRRDGGWWFDKLTMSGVEPGVAELGLPEGVRDVIGRRLPRLSEASNELLTLAAVVGREFGIATLERLSGMDAEALDLALDEAEAAGIVEVMPRASGRYRFGHALFREVLYAELPARRRLRLHLQVGEALEEQYAGDLESHSAELAYHFVQALPAGQGEKALAYSERAAARALATYAYEEAARHLEQALAVQEVLDPDDKAKRCDLLLALGEAMLPCEDPARAATLAAPEAFELAEALDDSGRAARAAVLALDALARAHGTFSQSVAAGGPEWLERADRHAAAGTPERILADAYAAWSQTDLAGTFTVHPLYRKAAAGALESGDGRAFFMPAALALLRLQALRDREARSALADEVLRRSRQGVRSGDLGICLSVAGFIFLGRGDRATAERAWSDLVELAERSRDTSVRVQAYQPSFALALLDGRLAEVASLSAEWQTLSEQLGVGNMGVTALRFLAYALIYLGRAAEALDLPLLATPSSRPNTALRALCLAHAGRQDEARTLREQFRNLGSDEDETSTNILQIMLETSILVGDLQTVSAVSRRLVVMADSVSDSVRPVACARLLGSAAALLGERDKAGGYFLQAIEVCTRTRFRPELALSHLALAELMFDEAVSHQPSAISNEPSAVSYQHPTRRLQTRSRIG